MAWGDSPSVFGTTGNTLQGYPPLTAPLPVKERTLDETTFSVHTETGQPLRVVGHMIGNLERFLRISDKQAKQILGDKGLVVKDMSPEELAAWIFTVGSAFDQEPPSSAENIYHHDVNTIGNIGIMPVQRLRLARAATD